MKIKLARELLSQEPKIIDIKDITKEEKDNLFLYLDRQNKEKEIKSAIKYLDKKFSSIHCRKITFGLNINDYLYELHIIK